MGVLQDWLANDVIKQRACLYKLMSFELGLSPEAAESHSVILAPLMHHLGLVVARY